MELNNIKTKDISWGEAASTLNENFGKISTDVEKIKNATIKNKGYFSSSADLISAFPSAQVGDYAYVGSQAPYQTWHWTNEGWIKLNDDGGAINVDLNNYYPKSEIDGKLTELESYYIFEQDLSEQMMSGYYSFSGKVGEVVSVDSFTDGEFRRIKIALEQGSELKFTGTGAGVPYETSKYVTENLTTGVINGYYSYSSTGVGTATTANRTTDGGWRCIAQSVKGGDKVTITGVGGGGARLYCLVNNNNIIKAIAPSGDSQTGFVLNVEEDGILYCSFNKSYEYSLTREYYQETTSSNAGARLYCITDADGLILDIADPDESVILKKISVDTSGFLYINVLASRTYYIALEYDRLESAENQLQVNTQSIEDIIDDVNTLNNKVDNLMSNLYENIVEDLTDDVSNGYYSYSSTAIGTITTATKTSDGGWRCIAQSVKGGDKVTITGVGGASARLYCLVNNNGIIKAIASAGDSKTGFVLNVEEDGMLYYSCDNKHPYSIKREYQERIDNESTTIGSWINGSYEFGRTCDCDYTSPTISAYSFPTSGKVSHIHSLYDALVAQYPKYVFKEDCDATMASLGVAKPSAIANLPMYMYKFLPPKAPNSSDYSATNSEANMIKAFIITGAHPEYTAIWDCYNAMRLVCEEWISDKNLEELRWNAEIYIIPCYNLHGVENMVRTNENGVDLNRNAPTKEWKVQGSYGDATYSGESAGSEYSTKVMMHYLQTIKPQIFIDHHNTNVGAGDDEGDGKNILYSHSINQILIDVSSVLISQMTRKWKKRFTDIFPSIEADPTTLFGYTLYDHIKGSIGRYGSEQGALGSTFETNFGILYKNGEYSTANRRNNSEVVNTCATEGFLNYLVRCMTACSSQVGIL